MERYWAKVSIKDVNECWPWLARITPEGYGQLRMGGKHIYAHRLAYMLAYGPIPKGNVIRHICDTRHCVNPAHLLRGTNADNAKDYAERGKGNPPVTTIGGGEKHSNNTRPNAKLTKADVLAIRASPKTGAELCNEYGITSPTMHRIRTGKSWKHI